MATDALNTARQALKKHAADPRAKMFRLDESLLAIDAAFELLELRQRQLLFGLLYLLDDLTAGRPIRRHPANLDVFEVLAEHHPDAQPIVQRLRARVCGEGG